LNALVLGAEGQLGTELSRRLPGAAALIGAPIDDADVVDAIFADRLPEVVFNCAAYNAVDGAEAERELAFASNERGPTVLAEAARRYGARLVHFSTNFVFDGALDRPYVEGDEPAPLSVYAASKLAGERGVLATAPDALVIRTAALYGGPRGFPHRIVEQALSSRPLRVVCDQRVNPTYARDLADVAMKLAAAGVSGIVHAVNHGCCGWDEFARAVLAEAGIDRGVEPVATGAYPAAARRPLNGCLASNRIEPLRPWREALREALTPAADP